MNFWTVLGLVFFAASFALVSLANYGATVSAVGTNATVSVYPISPISPPYAFDVYEGGQGFALKQGGVLGILNSYFFVFIFSLLFFGFSAFIAMGIEGAKYASMISTGSMPGYDLLFAVPQIFALIAATELGQGVMNDFEGKESIFENDGWKTAFVYFAAGIALAVVLVAARDFALPLLS